MADNLSISPISAGSQPGFHIPHDRLLILMPGIIVVIIDQIFRDNHEAWIFK
jgi:hypothetical protein